MRDTCREVPRFLLLADATTGSKRFAPILAGASRCFPCLRGWGCRRAKQERSQISVGLGDRPVLCGFGDAVAAEPGAATQEGCRAQAG